MEVPSWKDEGCQRWVWADGMRERGSRAGRRGQARKLDEKE